jgi:hypothetical protein
MSSDDETPQTKPVKVKKAANETQLANLRKGMEAMKLKRMQTTKSTPPPPIVIPPPVPVLAPAPVLAPVVKEKKPRKPALSRADLDEFKSSIMTSLKPSEVIKEVPVERVVEKVVEKIVHKDRLVTGSQMLNKLFFGID